MSSTIRMSGALEKRLKIHEKSTTKSVAIRINKFATAAPRAIKPAKKEDISA